MKRLGIHFNQVMSFGLHVQDLVKEAARRMYALKTIKKHGLVGHALLVVTRSTLQFSFYMQAQPGLVNRAVRYGFLPTSFPSLPELSHSADQFLFKLLTRNPRHVVYHLLVPVKSTGYSLLSQSHQFILPILSTALSRTNFINKIVFTGMF
jgi:hypothetical protein